MTRILDTVASIPQYLIHNPITRAGSGLSKAAWESIRSPFETYRKEDINLFVEACESGRLRYVKNYLERNPEAVSIRTSVYGEYLPLHIAAAKGQLEVMKYLLEKGADVNCRNKWGFTPLHLAVTEKNNDVVTFLIQRGADINAKSDASLTPLHIAATYQSSMIPVLISSGADSNAQDEYGTTPLMTAIKSKNLGSASLFLGENKTDVTIVDDKGKSALHHYLELGERHNYLEHLLCSHSSLMNKTTKIGLSPLHISLLHKKGDVVELINHGALVGGKDPAGRSPLHIALQKNDARSAFALFDAGVPIHVVDSLGYTPLDQARLSNMEDLILALSEKEIELRKNRFVDVRVLERGGDGSYVKDEKGAAKTFHYTMDGWTTDLYSQESGWKLRFKAIGTAAALPFYAAYAIVNQLGSIIVDIARIAIRAIKNFVRHCKNWEGIKALKSVTITPIWRAVRMTVWRCFKVAALPIFSTGILLGSLYTQIDAQTGRRLMNVISEGSGNKLLLQWTKLAKAGILSESQISGVAQFYLLQNEE